MWYPAVCELKSLRSFLLSCHACNGRSYGLRLVCSASVQFSGSLNVKIGGYNALQSGLTILPRPLTYPTRGGTCSIAGTCRILPA